MKQALCIAIIAALLTGCHSHRKAAEKSPHDISVSIEDEQKTTAHKGSRSELVKEAHKWIGTRYKYGGESRKGVDCSGLVMSVYRDQTGIKLPRSSAQQKEFCSPLERGQLLEADLVFFSTSRNGRVSHVGLYIGQGRFIHSSTSKGVIISSLDEDYYKRHYHSAGRVPGMSVEKSSKKDKRNKESDRIQQPVITAETAPKEDKQQSGNDRRRDMNKRSAKKKDGKSQTPAASAEIPVERLSEVLKSGSRDTTSTSRPETSPESAASDSIRDEVRKAMESFD